MEELLNGLFRLNSEITHQLLVEHHHTMEDPLGEQLRYSDTDATFLIQLVIVNTKKRNKIYRYGADKTTMNHNIWIEEKY